MVSCLLGFIFSGNANFVTGLHAWQFGDRLFALNCKKDQNNILTFLERTSFRAVKTLSEPSAIHLQTYCVLEQSASVLCETCFTFFSPKVPCEALRHCTCVLQRSSPSLLFHKRGTRLVQLSSLFNSHLSWSFLRNLFAKFKGLGR